MYTIHSICFSVSGKLSFTSIHPSEETIGRLAISSRASRRMYIWSIILSFSASEYSFESSNFQIRFIFASMISKACVLMGIEIKKVIQVAFLIVRLIDPED